MSHAPWSALNSRPQTQGVGDPDNWVNVIRPNSDGSINVVVTSASSVIETEQQSDGSRRQRVTIADMFLSLRNMLQQIARPIWFQSSAGALRITPVSGAATDTLGTVTTVTTVTGITNIGSVAASGFIYNTMMNTWLLGVRSRIT